ncbi:MAG: hypothetical protein ABI614_29700, partial [Planctomycetota bacterium]
MPATEQTWRNTKLLHKIFAVSGVVMLASTIWLLAIDHARPWKPYQRTANDVELRLTDWRKLQYETNDALALHKQLVDGLDAARREAIPESLVDAFVEQLKASPVTAGETGRAESIKTDAEKLTAVAGTPAAESIRDRVIKTMREIIEDLRVTEETRLGYLKFARAD